MELDKGEKETPSTVNHGVTTSGESSSPVQTILVNSTIQTNVEADVHEQADNSDDSAFERCAPQSLCPFGGGGKTFTDLLRLASSAKPNL